MAGQGLAPLPRRCPPCHRERTVYGPFIPLGTKHRDRSEIMKIMIMILTLRMLYRRTSSLCSSKNAPYAARPLHETWVAILCHLDPVKPLLTNFINVPQRRDLRWHKDLRQGRHDPHLGALLPCQVAYTRVGGVPYMAGTTPRAPPCC